MSNETLSIQPIAQGSLSQRAYAALRDGLIAGHFRPGQRLIMQELADQFGTSITPVREACMRLVSEGGLHLRSGRFAIVPPMTLARYMEVRLMRIQLEGLAAKEAAQRATAKDIAFLHEIHPRYAAADFDSTRADEAARFNREFHFAVYRMSRMEILVSHIESLWTAMGPMLAMFFNNFERSYIGEAGHARVIRAIEAGDGDAACLAIQRDIIEGGEDFVRYINQNAELSTS